MTIVMENSGIYKKGCVQMVCNGDGLGLCVRARVCVLCQSLAGEDHKRRIKALGHQCEMSSRSGGAAGLLSASPTLFECQPH